MDMSKIVCPKCGCDVKLNPGSRSGRCSRCDLSYSLGGAASLDASAFPTPATEQGAGGSAVSAPWHKAGITPPYAIGVSSATNVVNPKIEAEVKKVSEAPSALSTETAATVALGGAAVAGGALASSALEETEAAAPESAAEPSVATAEPFAATAEPIAEPKSAEPTVRQDVRMPYRASDAERAASAAIADADRKLVNKRRENADRASIQKKLRRADRALAKKKWKRADALYDEVLLADPERADAYLGKSLASRKVTGLRALGEQTDLSADKYFLLALHYSDGNLRRRLDSCADSSTKAKINESRRDLIDSEARRRALDRITESRLAEINSRAEAAEKDRKKRGISPEEADRQRVRRVSAELDRADRLREKGKWKKARAHYDAALEIDGESGEAYVGLLLTDLKLKSERELAKYDKDFESNENFLLAVHYGSRAIRMRLESALAAVQERNGLLPVKSSLRSRRRDGRAEEAGDAVPIPVPMVIPQSNPDVATGAELSRVSTELGTKLGSLESAGQQRASTMSAELTRVGTDLGTKIGGLETANQKRASAMSAELTRVGGEIGTRIASLEAATRQSELSAREREISLEHIAALERRLAVAERNALAARVDAAELSAIDARNYAFDKAEMTARLSASQLELARLRGLLGAPYGDEKVTVYGTIITTGREDLPRFLQKADKLRSRGKFVRAEEEYRKILTRDPTCAEAYLGCLLCELRLKKVKKLDRHDVSYSDRENYALAVRFATPELSNQLRQYAESTDRRVSKTADRRENARRENVRRVSRDRLSEREAVVVAEVGRRVEANRLAGVKITQKEEDARIDEIRYLVWKKNYAKAMVLIDELIALSPDLADAYLLRLMCTIPCRKAKGLAKATFDLRQNPDYILACRFGSKSTKRMLAKYAKKSRANAPDETLWDNAKLKRIDALDAADEKKRRKSFNRQSGDLAEAQRADMDVISARKAKARSRMIPPNVDKKLLSKGYRALRRKNWQKANRCFDEVIQKDPSNEDAFLGKLLASVPTTSVKGLAKSNVVLSTNRYYIVLQHIGSPALKDRLSEIAKRVDSRLNRGEEEYEKLSESRVMHRRLLLTERRLRDAEARNRKLEVETERLRKNKSYEEVYGSFRYGEESADGVTRKGHFSGLAVVAFLIGTALVTALSIGVAVLFAKFGGDFGAFMAALGL